MSLEVQKDTKGARAVYPVGDLFPRRDQDTRVLRTPAARIVARVAEHAAYEYLMHPVHN